MECFKPRMIRHEAHIVLASMVLLLAVLHIPKMEAGVPDFITYSGRITDGSYDGLSAQATITFRLYDAADGGEMLWEHEEAVVVQDGYFSVMLGQGAVGNQIKNITDVFAEYGDTWMELEVGGQALAERRRVGSVPYAGRSVRAERVEQLPPGQTQNLRWSRTAGTIRIASDSGESLNDVNPGLVSLPSIAEPGRHLTLKVTADVIFQDLDGDNGGDLKELTFGVNSGRKWDEWMPVFIYAVNLDDHDVAFAISRNPTATVVSISPSSGEQDIVLLTETLTDDVEGKPMCLIGATMMKKPADDNNWLIHEDDHRVGIGEAAIRFVAAKVYRFPVNQNYAQVGTHLYSSSDTPPTWSNPLSGTYNYNLSLTGFVTINYQTGGDASAGQSGGDLHLSLPFNCGEKGSLVAKYSQVGVVRYLDANSYRSLHGKLCDKPRRLRLLWYDNATFHDLNPANFISSNCDINATFRYKAF